MGIQECTGVDVPESRLLSNFAATLTTVPQRPTAGKVGVLDVSLEASSAATSTLPAAAAEGGNAGGVAVAEVLLPSMYASTPTPTDEFLMVTAAMQSDDVDVPELLL